MRQWSHRLRVKLGFVLLTIAGAMAITNFSTDNFSIKRTSRYFEPMVRFFLPNASADTVYILHVIFRKLGHLTEYAVFASLFFGIWAAGEERWSKKWLAYSLAAAAILALIDEYHQTFTRMREGLLSDSVIDIIGAAIGLLLLWLINREKFSPLARKI